MLPYKKPKIFRKYLVLFLVSYTALALMTGFFSSRGEIFPIFNGHWFVRTPHMFDDYGILLLSIDGKKLNQPAYLDQTMSQFPRQSPYRAYNLTQSLGETLEKEDLTAARQHLSTLQKIIFEGRPVQFEVRRRQFDSLEYLEEGRLRSSVPLSLEKIL